MSRLPRSFGFIIEQKNAGIVTEYDHFHTWVEVDRHENDDRIRVRLVCSGCESVKYGCFAKRLDSEGQESWGAVGKWTYANPSKPVDESKKA